VSWLSKRRLGMKYRKHNDFNVSEVGVGCYALSGVYGGKDVKEFMRMLNRAYELGVNFFDTADVYGDAEQILGEVVKPYRHDFYIATKMGMTGDVKPNLSTKYVKSACEKSLERLQTDYIDLYQLHFDDPNTPVGEKYGMASIGFSATGRGLLTGRFQKGKKFEPGDIRNLDPLFQRESFQSSLRVGEKLAKVGRSYGKTPV